MSNKTSKTSMTGAGPAQGKPDILSDAAKAAFLGPLQKRSKMIAAARVKKLAAGIDGLGLQCTERVKAHQEKARLVELYRLLQDSSTILKGFPEIAEQETRLKELRLELFGDGRYVNGVYIPKAANNGALAQEYDALKAALDEAKRAILKPYTDALEEMRAEVKASGALEIVNREQAELQARREQSQSASVLKGD